MLDITLNPGFIPLFAALLMLAAPHALRAPLAALSGFSALWLLLDREFGVDASTEQMGLRIVPLELDALNQVFGIGLLIALVVIAAYSSGRRNRFEDCAMLVLAGGAVSALFVGDLILFAATAALASFGAAWVVFASPLPGSARAGVRLLVWQGLEGLLFLVGIALHISDNEGVTAIRRLGVGELSGAFIFAALMIRVGAPLAHVWFKDAVAHASPVGAAAVSAFSAMLGVYALARFFPAEPVLLPVGAAMIVLGAFYAAAEDDLRAAGAYAQTAQIGVALTLVGLGSPLALAAVEAHTFACILAFAALQMSLGNVVERRGEARASALAGLGRAMPFTSAFLLLTGLAAAGAPGFAVYPTFAAALEASAQWETRWLWTLYSCLPAILFVALCLRTSLAAHQPAAAARYEDAPYGMLLGVSLASFFCVAIGVAPHWLYNLTPTEMSIDPFAFDRLARQLELMGAAGAAFLLLRFARVTPLEARVRLLDLDAVYRGPIAAAGRWSGATALRALGSVQAVLESASVQAGARMEAWLRSLDRPYLQRWAAPAQFIAIGAAVLLALFVGAN